jgi:uncharacterized membrane protein YeaQ/YmgE (transglycosylase-associated protein family)
MAETFYVSSRLARVSHRIPPESQSRFDTERRADMGILSWIVLGLIAGAIAKFLMPGRDPGGCIITMIIGIVGALLGGFLATLLGFGGLSGFDLRSVIIAIIGSIVLLIIWRMISGRRV